MQKINAYSKVRLGKTYGIYSPTTPVTCVCVVFLYL